MRVILFQDRFAELVRSGWKRQTIRKKALCGPGDTLSLRRWTGKPRRSKQEVLLEAVCKEISPVIIGERGYVVGVLYHYGDSDDADAFAQADGFSDYPAMVKWFRETHGLTFRGELIKWETGITIMRKTLKNYLTKSVHCTRIS